MIEQIKTAPFQCEEKPEIIVTFLILGTLRDMSLGQDKEGISTNLQIDWSQDPGHNKALTTFYNSIARALEPIDGLTHLNCVDGRCSYCKSILARLAGAYISYIFADLCCQQSEASETYQVDFDRYFDMNQPDLPYFPSTHDNGCAAENLFAKCVENLSTDHSLINNAAELLTLIKDREPNDQQHIDILKLAGLMSSLSNALINVNDINLQERVDENSPRHHVERLTEEEHREQAIVLIKGEYSINITTLANNGIGQVFVVNISAIEKIVDFLSKNKNIEALSEDELFTLLLAFQMSVFNSLCNNNMPVLLAEVVPKTE